MIKMDEQLRITEALAHDIVKWKLDEEISTTQLSTSVKTLRRIASDLDISHGDIFSSMLQVISEQGKDIPKSFIAISENMFSDNVVNWGRIAVLFTFAGHLAKFCQRNELLERPDVVSTWLVEFVNAHLLEWVVEVGGWVSVNKIFH